MGDESDVTWFDDEAGLLAYLGAGSLEEAGHLVSEETDPDVSLFEINGEIHLGMGAQGFILTFPMSSTDFWAMVNDLEDDWFAGAGSEQAMSWDSPELFPVNEPARVARYRRLQSWYRAEVLHASAGASGRYTALGSYLDRTEVAANPRLNFLTDAALSHAEERIVAVRAEGGALDPVRLRHNMLSSMPLCFNLFGSMTDQPDFLSVFRLLFDREATVIDDVVCEWAPLPTSDYLGDRTAFDAVVFYKAGSEHRFCGIETKYTESFSVTEYARPTYDAITRSSGWFSDPDAAITTLVGRASNQLWRNACLAAAVEERGRHGSGRVAVVSLADDPGAAAAVAAVSGALAQPERLRSVSLEDIVAALLGIPALSEFAREFERRYLDLIPIHDNREGSAARD